MLTLVIPLIASALSIVGIIGESFISKVLEPYVKALEPYFRAIGIKVELEKKPRTFGQKIDILARTLKTASSELDQALRELEQIVQARQITKNKLEEQVNSLSKEERGLRTALKDLEKVSPEAAQYFVKLEDKAAKEREKGQAKRDRRHDLIWFAFGSISSAVIAILLHLLKLT